MRIENKFIEDLIISPIARRLMTIDCSQYVPGSKGITIDREIGSIYTRNGLDVKFDRELDNPDIAIHNIAIVKRKKRFIPMIDLCIEDITNIESIEELKLLDVPMYIYSSGRSYHVYFLTFLKKSDWVKFLGRCLLLNDRNQPFEIVDSRWIGHSLEKGYSALRITQNNEVYLKKPELIKIIN